MWQSSVSPAEKSSTSAQVQVGVLQTLSDPAGGYGANTVTDVTCNNGHNPSANKGTTFTCEATVNGAQRHVTVVVSDDNGTYEIDAPIVFRLTAQTSDKEDPQDVTRPEHCHLRSLN